MKKGLGIASIVAGVAFAGLGIYGLVKKDDEAYDFDDELFGEEADDEVSAPAVTPNTAM